MDPKEGASGRIEGLSRQDALVGLTATAEHRLEQRGFDLVAALFGAPDAAPGEMPDAANALILQSIVLDFAARSLPGPGCEVLAEELRFLLDPAPGDQLAITGTISARPAEDTATLALVIDSQRGRLAEGSLTLRLPAQRVAMRAEARPSIVLNRHRHLERLMARSAEVPPLAAAVAWPCDRDSLLGPLEARASGALHPILVGPRTVMEKVAAAHGVSLDGCEVVEAETPHAAAAAAALLCREGRAAALMKGSLHTDELMSAVVSREGGLRAGRRISHVFAMDVPSYHKPLFITDAAVNIAPDLMTKADIVQNAVDMLHALGTPAPKVAILAAVETVNPGMPSTLDAAALCKMADRGQISGAVLDGPLAFDNAISRAAAAVKKIASPVAGDADVLVAPDLEAGNMIAKQLSYLANAASAGIVLGARVPVILTSRADSVMTRLASIALARLLVASGKDGIA
ncbi:bifunctional enoyl-CoA hydratase/phosphate acetyltransferase [Falsiroseomonas oryzae]|uniref:bifunctional enoyl-CoA hydratase/phosphate acetyltransferase n=1 Tax=Falsiroseomonas oryzae TaxID=2766473 RepID=UPI0022EADBC1|nr:bifunctional enoyl-CoA hydratase/phosphate acetyltransferase [Roseomonas sp. MO-31]